MPSAPVPPPRDETGDAETVGVDSEPEDREPLSPGVAMSGPEAGKRVMPEKHVVPTLVQRVKQVVAEQYDAPSLATKSAVQFRPHAVGAPLVKSAQQQHVAVPSNKVPVKSVPLQPEADALEERSAVDNDSIEVLPIEEPEEIPQGVFSSRMGSPVSSLKCGRQ